jgi:hypothetical protein
VKRFIHGTEQGEVFDAVASERTTNNRALERKAMNATTEPWLKRTQNLLPLVRHSYVLEGTSHQTRPKIDAGDASLLTGSIN